jgi:S1-C subfamily serine protease
MSICLLMLLTLGQNGQVESKDFSKDAQTVALRATVKVVNLTKNREASAVIIKQEAKFVYFLTAAHAARVGDKLEIHTFTAESYPNPAEKYKSAEVLASDKERDIAVIRLLTTDTMPGVLPLCPVKKVPDDKDFPGLSIGCGGGKAPLCQIETVRRKVKAQRPGEKDTTLVWEIAEAPANGRSGGPLVDQRGLVIGVASGANDGQGYYVHIDEIHRFMKKNRLERLYEEEQK